jgi:hypothetical protein
MLFLAEAPAAAKVRPLFDNDCILKNNHHQRARQHLAVVKDNENHRAAAAPREINPAAGSDFDLVRAAYEKATGNRWSRSDTETYEKHRLDGIPIGKIISVLEAVVGRTPAKINSFAIPQLPPPCVGLPCASKRGRDSV